MAKPVILEDMDRGTRDGQSHGRSALFVVIAGVAIAAGMFSIGRAQSSAGAELLAQVDAITKKVSKLRGLALKHTIKRGVMNKTMVKARLLSRIESEYTPAQIRGEELAMKRFGLLEQGADYLETVTRLLTNEIAGFYDPVSAELVLAGWASAGGEPLLAHEIDHALQDQHFGLRRFMLGEKSNADATAARQALVEGDGTALMMEYALAGLGRTAPWAEPGFADSVAEMTAGQAASIKDAPFALREGLLFPYAEGLRFVAHFRQLNDWKRIDAMFAKPPLSTEHILHPELYEAYQQPILIATKTPSIISSYQLVYDNVSGEKGLSVLLEAHGVSRARAQEAAAGWGGDRIAIFVPPGFKLKKGAKVNGIIGVLRTTWDQEADAIEFFDALSYALPRLSANGVLVTGGSSTLLRYRSPDGSLTTASRNRSEVTVLVGAPPAREPDLRAAIAAW